MKKSLFGSSCTVGLLLSAWMLLQNAPGAVTGLEVSPTASGQGDSAKTADTRSKGDGAKAEPNGGAPTKHSSGVEEVLKMVKAGVSTEVIKAYIESSPIAYRLTATEIVALKEQAVPDELTTAMLKRGAALRTEVSQAKNADAGRNRRYYAFDPESYDYFQYYYLYPRTLASANQRLFSGGAPFSGYPLNGYGYYGPLPFSALPPSAFWHP